MLTTVILDSGEPNVIKLTYENLHKELKDIPGSKIVVSDSWFGGLGQIKTPYVCFVEADCLVNSGYFSSLLGLYTKSSTYDQLAVMSSKTGVNDWSNVFYGYSIGSHYSDGVVPSTEKKSTHPYPVQIAYIPGALIRTNRLMTLLGKLDLKPSAAEDLVYFSTLISLGFWEIGRRININPNTTYVTTEDYVNEIGKFPHDGAKLVNKFKRESI
jgi:hypothetical protein